MATLQVASQQTQPPVGTSSYGVDSSSTSLRQYQQQTPPLSDQARSASNARNSPHSPRRHSRRPIGSNQQAGTSEPPQSTFHSPGGSQTPASITPRVPDVSTTHASPIGPVTTSSPSHEHQRNRRDQRGQNAQQGGPPFSPPPRTSSTQRNQSISLPSDAPLVDRTIPSQQSPQSYDDRPSSARKTGDPQPQRTANRPEGATRAQPSGREQDVSNEATIAAVSAAQSRRRGPTTPTGPQRAISTREPATQQPSNTTQSRSASNYVISSATSRSNREEDQIVKRVVVDDPAIDIRREEERQLESVPGLAVTHNVPASNASTTTTTTTATPRSRQDFSAQNAASSGRRKETKFGEYVLGQTLGEGEFGKVKLGWKKDGSVQVAIKLIRRESLGSNPSRLPKIHREINILETLHHPNIVKLHEMVETPQYIGIILEYASGGELFDYILTHRYLKDNTARKLFAQLVSGVGYLHKKGIVHRDLKLENLLLDRNRNIIITDFGFANTFDPRDELGDEVEYNLTNREFVKKMDLERIRNGTRRGDLMATSCGSPCYAAPELVVTDSLYTGRKVDVWSCGVILYAMLAGYLPFDDDPDNPEGDNINLLYKYITTTPLTFPEYVTPHARDLLRRILVADPRKRADLFEVARHSWLSDFAHVVAQVTSSTTTVGEIANTTVTADAQDAPTLVRSHSVREPAKAVPSGISPVGGLSHQGKIDPDQAADKNKAPRDPKRRTVQVEYVAPSSQTTRGEGMPNVGSPGTDGSTTLTPTGPLKGRARAGTERSEAVPRQVSDTSKPLPQDPRFRPGNAFPTQPSVNKASQRPVSSARDMAPPPRPSKDFPRATSDSTGAFRQSPISTSRPATGGSMTSTGHGRLPSRGNSYSQPLAPTVAATNAQGRVTQPKGENKYNISNPMPLPEPSIPDEPGGRPRTQQHTPPTIFSGNNDQARTHKRSNTFGNFFRTGSISGPRSQPQTPGDTPQKDKRYPPTSMRAPIVPDTSPRQSTDSRRPSFSFGRKSSDPKKTRENSDLSMQERPRRFSLLPASFSFRGFTGNGSGKDLSSAVRPASEQRQSANQNALSSGQVPSRPQTMNHQKGQGGSYAPKPQGDLDGQRETIRDNQAHQPRSNDRSRGGVQVLSAQYGASRYQNQDERYLPPKFQQQGQSYQYQEHPTESNLSLQNRTHRPVYPPGFSSEDQEDLTGPSIQQSRPARGPAVLTKNHRKFAEAYDQDQQPGSGGGHHAGSSGAAKRVMDFFRRRGKARAGEDRV